MSGWSCEGCGRRLDNKDDPGSARHGEVCQTCCLELEEARLGYRHILLVCGGVNFEDYGYLERTLDRVHREDPISLLINGNAKGADKMSSLWAIDRGMGGRLMTYSAKWRVYGKRAGPIRNGEMLRKSVPSHVLAFPGRTGTANMLTQARAEAKKRPLLITDLRQGDLLL